MSLGTPDPFLREYANTRRYLAGRPVCVTVTPDGKSALFLRSEANDAQQKLLELDLSTQEVKVLLTPHMVLGETTEELSVAQKARLERQRVSARGFTSYQLTDDGAHILVTLSGRLFLLHRPSGKVLALRSGPGACIDPKLSPDGTAVAYVRDFDVRLLTFADNVERQLTSGGNETKSHGLAEFVAQEEMGRFSGFWFSPDGKSLAFQETDHSGMDRLAMLDPMKPAVQPETFFYPRPGKKNAAVRVGIVSLAGGAPTWVSWDVQTYPYLASVVWNDGPLTLVVQNRAQTCEQVLAVEVVSGKSTVLLTEEDSAWLNLDQSFPLWWKDVGFFWVTERNGAPEVELRQPNGAWLASWVPPTAGFDEVVGFDEDSKTLYFTGGPNPTASFLFQVTQGTAPRRVNSSGDALCMVSANLTGAGRFFALNHTSTRAMPVHVVMDVLGDSSWVVPSVAVEPSMSLAIDIVQLPSDGPWAAVLKPAHFVKGKKYPVVLNVYGGPRHSEVLQSMRENVVLQWLANQGFIVVKVDGRGTPRRTRAWERAIHQDLAAVPAHDQIAALSQLAELVPEIDLSRVGVYGWSFGGYLAAFLGLTRGDVIKSCVAGAPVVDWYDYDSHYTERYLGLPETHSGRYDECSLLTHVEHASCPMLLVHGTADDNVYFSHTLKLSDALFRAGKEHCVLPLTNFTHMVPDPLVTQRLWERIAQWFKETL